MVVAGEAAGGLPEHGTSPGLWLHALTKAGGPLQAPDITALAVMNLPLPQNKATGNAAQTGQQEPGSQSAQPLPEASAEQRQYANQLTASLIDTGNMRRLAILPQPARRAPTTQDQNRLIRSARAPRASASAWTCRRRSSAPRPAESMHRTEPVPAMTVLTLWKTFLGKTVGNERQCLQVQMASSTRIWSGKPCTKSHVAPVYRVG